MPVSLKPEATSGNSIFGITTFFPFNFNLADPGSFRSFTVQGHGPSKTFATQSSAFIVPSLTTKISPATTIVNLTIAVSSSSNPYAEGSDSPIVNLQAPVAQMGTLGPAISKFSNIAISNIGSRAGYTLWSGSVDVGTGLTGPVSIALLDNNGDEIDLVFV